MFMRSPKETMMNNIILDLLVLLALINSCCGLTPLPVTGTTPPPVTCHKSLCNGRADGNYAYESNRHYFVQCVNGKARCQACFPLHLVFKEDCNQCLYDLKDECLTTTEFIPNRQYFCPDKCRHRESNFTGNIKDPYNPHHYVACLNGETIGCIKCPAELQFNEKWNACLHDGEFKTQSQDEFIGEEYV